MAHLPAGAHALRRRRSIDALTRPETWPDYASEIGRFTPLRPGGLAGQTFEIEVAAGTDAGRPLFTRGYVDDHRPRHARRPGGARAPGSRRWRTGSRATARTSRARFPRAASRWSASTSRPTTGHFMGAGHNRLLLYTHAGEAWVRAAGTWDPMPWHIDRAYRSPAATPSTRSGARARWRARACCTSSPRGSSA